MKNLIILSLFISLISCGKKEDVNPTAKKIVSADKKIYYKFEVLPGTSDGLLYKANIAVYSGSQVVYNKISSIYKYTTSSIPLFAYFPLVDLKKNQLDSTASIIKVQLNYGKFETTMTGKTSISESKFTLMEKDTCYIVSVSRGEVLKY